MSGAHVAVLDSTIQQTNVWLKKLETEHHFRDRQHAYGALRAVLHALRDHLTTDQTVRLGAQLPMLVRGIYYDGWKGAGHAGERHLEEFLSQVEAELPQNFPRDALGVARAVCDLLWKELDPGETAKLISHLPTRMRAIWPVELGR